MLNPNEWDDLIGSIIALLALALAVWFTLALAL